MKKAYLPFTFKNGVTLKNKLILAPMTTSSSNIDLTLSDEEEIYYNSRAKQFGMVITAAVAVNKDAQGFKNQISIRDGRYLESMKRLANAIKKENSKAIIQLYHGGRMNPPGLYTNQDIVSASAVKAQREYAVVPRELKTSEIYDIIDDFVNAAKLAIKAGFDGVELHGANTYLLQQFFSPHSNRRTDEFGGNISKRLHFPLTLTKRIIQLKKELNRPDFIVGYRLSPEEQEIPGITIDDTLVLISALKKLKIDYLHLSLRSYDQGAQKDSDNTTPIVRIVKNLLKNSIPIVGVGGIDSNEKINDAFRCGYQLLSLGTIALSDPNVVYNLENNRIPNKEFSENSLLPQPLYNALSTWLSGLNGYSFKSK
jgi:2,4-dienoyl-CoA reductase-like NADH-dependent reductase (Old Yellow Enzyme family)